MKIKRVCATCWLFRRVKKKDGWDDGISGLCHYDPRVIPIGGSSNTGPADKHFCSHWFLKNKANSERGE
jgi:hypothetical protein